MCSAVLMFQGIGPVYALAFSLAKTHWARVYVCVCYERGAGKRS